MLGSPKDTETGQQGLGGNWPNSGRHQDVIAAFELRWWDLGFDTIVTSECGGTRRTLDASRGGGGGNAKNGRRTLKPLRHPHRRDCFSTRPEPYHGEDAEHDEGHQQANLGR